MTWRRTIRLTWVLVLNSLVAGTVMLFARSTADRSAISVVTVWAFGLFFVVLAFFGIYLEYNRGPFAEFINVPLPFSLFLLLLIHDVLYKPPHDANYSHQHAMAHARAFVLMGAFVVSVMIAVVTLIVYFVTVINPAELRSAGTGEGARPHA